MRTLLFPLLCALAADTALAWFLHLPAAGWEAYLGMAGVAALLGSLLGGGIQRLRGRTFPRFSLLLYLVVTSIALVHRAVAPPGPMVLLIVVDCFRADAFTPENAPNLSRLASSSWRFTNVHAHSSWTRTSMPSLLSSRLPAEHGLYRTRPPDRIRADVKLVAQYFSQNGWLTAGFAEQAQLVPAFGYARGSQIYTAGAGPASRLQQKARTWNDLFQTAPRFLFLHYLDIHGPYTPRRKWLAKNLPSTSLPMSPSTAWRTTIRGIRQGTLHPTPEDWTALRGHYEAEIRSLDDEMGRLLRRWQADGTLDRAWLVVTADHGEAFGEHGAVEHVGTPWDVLLRVPLVIRPPGGTAGQSFDTPVMLADVLPTLLSAKGLAIPSELYGRDLLPLTRGESIPDVPGFAEERAGPMQRVAVWWKGWKLLLEAPLPGTTARQLQRAEPYLRAPQLFHLAEDPEETTDLSTVHPEKLRELEGILVAYQEAVAEKRPVRTVDWEAAARSGKRWTPQEQAADAASPSGRTLKALEELGYLEGDGAESPGER